MSVLVPYQRMIRPCSSRNGLPRMRNQRYCPSLTAQAHFHLVGQAAGNQPPAFSQGALDVVRMNERRQMVRRGILGAQAVILAGDPIGIDPGAVRIQDKDMLRHDIDQLLQLFFTLPELFFRAFCRGDIRYRPDKLQRA